MDPIPSLITRLDRLEAENRRLRMALLCVFSLLGILLASGWIAARADVADILQVHRLEVVDARGVPLVTLAPARLNTGGSILLRDSQGEKRSWWEAAPGTSRLVMDSPAQKGAGDTVSGLTAGPGTTRLSLISPKGATISAEIQNETPQFLIQAPNGATLFSAPWRR